MPLALLHVPGRVAICRLGPTEPVPSWATTGDFVSITRTHDELSVVCNAAGVPDNIRAERDLTALRVEGTLELTMVGVLSALAAPLATARIPIFVVSTFDTDWLLIRESHYDIATRVLREAGVAVRESA